MKTEKEEITIRELIKGCCSSTSKCKSMKTSQGVRALRFSWEKKENISGDQFIWIIYHKEWKKLKRVICEINNHLNELTNMGTVFYDLTKLKENQTHLPWDINMFSDGSVSCDYGDISIDGKHWSSIAVYVGQGRRYKKGSFLPFFHILSSWCDVKNDINIIKSREGWDKLHTQYPKIIKKSKKVDRK